MMVSEMQHLGIHFVNLQPLTPFPGTGVSPVNGSLIIDKADYEKWDLAHITVMPKQMSVVDFYKQILKSYQQILFQPRIILDYLLHQSWAMVLQFFLVLMFFSVQVLSDPAVF